MQFFNFLILYEGILSLKKTYALTPKIKIEVKKPKVNYDEIIKTVLNKEKTNYVSSDVESNKHTKVTNTEVFETEESSKTPSNVKKFKTGGKTIQETLEKILHNAENAAAKKTEKKDISVKNRIGNEKVLGKNISYQTIQEDKKSKIYSNSNNKINNINVNVKNIDLTDCLKDTANNLKQTNKVTMNSNLKKFTKSPHLNQTKSNFEKVNSNAFNSSKVMSQTLTTIEKTSKEKDNLANTINSQQIQPEKKNERRYTKPEKSNKKDLDIIQKTNLKELNSSQTLKKMKVKKDSNVISNKIEKSTTPIISDKPLYTNNNNYQIYLNSAAKCSKTVELDLNRCSSEKVIFKKITNFNIIPTVRTNLYDYTQTVESNPLNTSENNTIFNTFKRSIVSLSEARKNKSLTKQNTNSFSEESLNNIKKIKDSHEGNNSQKKDFNLTTNTTHSNKVSTVNPFKKNSENDNKVYSYDDTSYKEFKRPSWSLDHNVYKTEENGENVNTNRRRILDQYRTKLKLMNLNKDEFTYNTNNTEL